MGEPAAQCKVVASGKCFLVSSQRRPRRLLHAHGVRSSSYFMRNSPGRKYIQQREMEEHHKAVFAQRVHAVPKKVHAMRR